MAIDKYLKEEEMKEALELMAEAAFEKVMLPAMKRVVDDSSMPYDDMLLQQAVPFIRAALNKIDDDKEN